MCELLGGRYDYGLDIGGKTPVGIRDRPFVFEVQHVAYTPDDMVYTKFTAGIDGKVVVLYHFDALHTLGYLSDYVNPLVHGEETSLVLVDTHCYDNLIEHRQSPFEDIEMSGSEWIERSGKQSYPFHDSL